MCSCLIVSWPSVVIFAPIVGSVVLLTIIPVAVSTIMAYCVTGYIRDELFANVVKKCIGPCCSFFVSSNNLTLILILLHNMDTSNYNNWHSYLIIYTNMVSLYLLCISTRWFCYDSTRLCVTGVRCILMGIFLFSHWTCHPFSS